MRIKFQILLILVFMLLISIKGLCQDVKIQFIYDLAGKRTLKFTPPPPPTKKSELNLNDSTIFLTEKIKTLIFPNPTNDFIYITTNNDLSLPIFYSITESTGIELLKGNSSSLEFSIDLTNLPPSSYILTLSDLKKKRYTRIIIKQN